MQEVGLGDFAAGTEILDLGGCETIQSVVAATHSYISYGARKIQGLVQIQACGEKYHVGNDCAMVLTMRLLLSSVYDQHHSSTVGADECLQPSATDHSRPQDC